MAIPTNRSLNSTAEEHLADHLALAAKVNELDEFGLRSIPDNGVSSGKIQNGAITYSKLAQDVYSAFVSVDDGRLSNMRVPLDGSVTFGKLDVGTQNAINNSLAEITTSRIADAAVTIPKLSATGTKDSTTFLRGDGTWAVPAGGGGGTVDIVERDRALFMGLLPSGQQIVAETVPRRTVTSATPGIVSGMVVAGAIFLKAGTVVRNITFFKGTTAGATLTSTRYWLCTSDDATATSYTIRAQTAEDTSTSWAASTFRRLALLSPYTVPSDGLYYLMCGILGTTPGNLAVSNAPVLPLNPSTGWKSGVGPYSSGSQASTTVGSTMINTTGLSVQAAPYAAVDSDV